MNIIVKQNPYDDNYFDDTDKEVKSEVYYDSKVKIKGFSERRKKDSLRSRRKNNA